MRKLIIRRGSYKTSVFRKSSGVFMKNPVNFILAVCKMAVIVLICAFAFTLSSCDSLLNGGIGENDDGNTDSTDTTEPGQGGDGNDGNNDDPIGGGNDDDPPAENTGITAAQLTAQIKIGWNLGDSLDAHGMDAGNQTVEKMEEYWGNPVTTKQLITAVKNAGFNAIRIPVSWTKAADSNYNIRPEWMTRVKQVVDYAVENDMYIILNTHHDENVFKFTNSEMTASLAAFKKIWEQIANTFKDYNEKLVFEGLNEPRTKGSAAEWIGGTPEERANLNSYYQLFVNTVRGSGGKNGQRVLLINPYAASATGTAVNALVLPTDTVSNKLIVSIHAYTPNDFALDIESPVNTWSVSNPNDTDTIRQALLPAYEKYVKNGIPVIVGEFGANNKNNTPARAEWAKFYVSYAASIGMKCFWWDMGKTEVSTKADSFGLFNRNNNTIVFPDIINAMKEGLDSPPPEPVDNSNPKPISGNMGNYIFGNNSGTPDYRQAVWTLTGTNLSNAKINGTKLVLVLSIAPNSGMELIWQGPNDPSGNKWWQQRAILGDAGVSNAISGVTWNAGTMTLTINLAQALDDYSSFVTQSSINLIIAYYSTSNINNIGIVSANIVP